MRHHLDELLEDREQMLDELGGVALDMHRRDHLDVALLEDRAAEIAEVEDDIELLRTGLEQGIGIEELQKIAIERRQARAAPED